MSVLERRRADYNEGHPATLPISSDLPLSEPVTLTDRTILTVSQV